MKLLACLAILAIGVRASAQEDGAETVRRLRDKLAATKITLDFTNAKLDEVVAYVQEFSGLNFHIDEAARAKDDASDRITIKLKDVSLRAALRLVLHPRDLRCVYRNGVIVVTTKARLGSQTITRVYEARDLMLALQDFQGPRVELTAPGGAGQGLAGATFILEDPRVTLDKDFLTELIKTTTGENSWEDGANSIVEINGLIVISQSRQVHEEIQRFLDRLRMFK